MPQQTAMIHALAVSALLCVGCDGAPRPQDTDRQTSAAAGKADAPDGSCASAQQQQTVSCGGQGSGGCWCDEQCATYGDCCSDAAVACGVDTCAPDGDACSPGLSCAELDGVFDCRSACDLASAGDGTVACPPQWRLASNFAGLAFCLREGLKTTDQAEPRCDGLHDGVLAYSDPNGAACPDDAEAREHAEGASCAFVGLQPPAQAKSYCNYIADSDVLGYYWDACPPATEPSVGPDDEQRCGLRPASLPVGAQSYCNYIEDGYFGFYWDLADDPDYACPPQTRFAPNGEGGGFCLVEYDAMPGHVRAWCDPDAAHVGYEWTAGCEG